MFFRKNKTTQAEPEQKEKPRGEICITLFHEDDCFTRAKNLIKISGLGGYTSFMVGPMAEMIMKYQAIDKEHREKREESPFVKYVGLNGGVE